MTTLAPTPPAAPTAVSPEIVACLAGQADQLQTAVHANLRQHFIQNHGRLMSPRQLPGFSQEITQNFLHYLHHADLPHLTTTVHQLAAHGLGHLSALAVVDALFTTTNTLLSEAQLLTITPYLNEYRHHFLHHYMQAREQIIITARESFYQNVEAALERQVRQERTLRQELLESELRFKSLVNNIPGTVYRCAVDPDYTMELMSEDVLELSGYPATDFIGSRVRTYASVICEEDQAVVDAAVLHGVEAHTPYAIEYRIRHADGRLVWIGEWGQAVYDDKGNPLWLDGVLINISAQKAADEALAKRARELQAVTDVSTAVATILEPTTLLQELSDLTKARFNLYHAHVYLLDETSQTLVLAAGAGDVGRQMVAQGWQIPVHRERSVVARAARTRRGAIINNVRAEPDFLPNSLLPETRAELAVPIIVGEQVMGILDVQAAETDYFSEEDATIMTTLATQIGVAVQNARSFAASEAARRELSQLTRRLTREGWQDYLALQQQPILSVAVGQPPANGQTLQQPLVVQGEAIGQLVLAEPQAFSQEAEEIVTAVIERLSSHIENLRLTAQTSAALAQTEQQAERLALLNEMGAALGNATTVDEIYQIVAHYTVEILSSDMVTLSLLEPSGDCFQIIGLHGPKPDVFPGGSFPLANTAVERTIREQRLLIAPQDFVEQPTTDVGVLAMQGIHSFICAPLTAGERPLGALNIGREKANAYGTTDAYLVQQIVALFAATLESHRLFEETKRRAEREALVNAISQKIQSAPTIQSAMQTAVTELGKALQIKRTVVELNQTGTLPQI
jgi:PAS domain S-box-containing protein